MLHEIVSARRILNPKKDEYHLKKQTIQDCIYGVDIDPGAVDIAKLRLWLSLVVDYELKDIEPLPNLDYKIMCGNSLLEEFEGIRFYIGDTNEVTLFKDERKHKIQELRERVRGYFGIYDEKEKPRKREEINRLKDWFIKATLEKRRKEITVQRRRIESAANMFEEKSRQEYFAIQSKIFVSEAKINEVLRELHNPQKARPFFIWKLEFMDVFEDKGGFDVIIANPPYVGEKGHKDIFREIKQNSLGIFHQGKVDLFYFFFHLALNIVRKSGQVAFITTNYYPTATSAKKLRIDFKNRAVIRRIINFNELRIFESALGQHNMITMIEKGQAIEDFAYNCITKRTGNASSDLLRGILNGMDSCTDYYQIKQKDIYDSEEHYMRFGEASAGSNSIMQGIINKIASNKILLSEICHINLGCHITLSKITNNHLISFKGDYYEDTGVFVLSKKEVEELDLSNDEKIVIKPFIKNSDIHRYHISKSDEKLIYLSWKDDIGKYPKIKKHLQRFRKIFDDQIYRYNEPTWPWFAIHRPRESFLFETLNKIILPYRSKLNTFAYSNSPIYASGDVFFIVLKNREKYFIKYILALLNSKLYYLWLYHKGKRKGETLELYQKPLSEIPIKKISESQQKPFVELVDRILAITKDKDYLDNSAKQAKVQEYERQIDQMVYKLYGLTKEEIEIVENFKK